VKRVFKNDDACKAEVTDLAAYGKKFNPFHLVDREPPGGKLSGSPTLQRIPTIRCPRSPHSSTRFFEVAPHHTALLKNLSANLDNTLIPNSQIAGGPEREVEDAATNVWSTVRNANNH
jgi:hypothetical protein